jgi:hypothetical protein
MQIVSTQFLHFVSALLFFYTTLDEQLLLLCHRNFKEERMCFFLFFAFACMQGGMIWSSQFSLAE